MKKLFFLLMAYLVMGVGNLWAADLINVDFTTVTPMVNSDFSQNETPTPVTIGEKEWKFLCNSTTKTNYSIDDTNGLTFCSNNYESGKYLIGIPLTDINGSITVTFKHAYNEKKASFYVLFKEGEYTNNPGNASTVKDGSDTDTECAVTIDNITATEGYLYIGRASTSFTYLKGITVTTPSGSLKLTAAQNYTWTFNDNAEQTANSTSAILSSGSYNFEINNAAISTVSSTNVTDLADYAITKRVYFDGTGNTTSKFVRVKIQGPAKITVWGLSSSSTEARTLKINCGGTIQDVAVNASGGTIDPGSYFYTGKDAQDVYIYSENSGIYLYGIKVEPTLSQFEFNPDEVYYYNEAGTSGEYVNNTTFEQNTNYKYLRLKAKISPDLTSLTNPSFIITSSKTGVIGGSSPTVWKPTSNGDNRIYFGKLEVNGTGTTTLTFTFNGADNCAGPQSFSVDFTIAEPTAPTVSMTTPATTTDVAVNTSIVLTTDRTVTAVGETITGKLNDTDITFTLTDGNTLTYTPASNLANATTYTVKLNANQVQGSNGVNNTEETFSFTTVAAVSGLTAVYDRIWNFSDWSSGTYSSGIVEGQNIEVITNSDLTVDGSNKSFTDNDETADNLGTLNFTKRIKTGGASAGANRLLHIKVKAGATIQIVAASQGSDTRTLYLCKDSYKTDAAVATLSAGTTLSKLKYTHSGEGDADFYIGTSNGIGIYYIKVSSTRTSVSMRPSGSQTGTSESNALATNTTFNFSIVPTVSGGTISNIFSAGDISSTQFEITTSDPSIIDVSGVTYSASDDDITKGRFYAIGLKTGTIGGSATITLRYLGNATYSEASTTFTLYVNGPRPFDMNVSNLTVQNGQKAYIMPTIINSDGNAIGFDESNNVIVLDDETTVDYDNYFDFTYAIASNDAGLTLDATDNSIIVSARDEAYVGKKATITVTARPKSIYASNFTNSSVSKTLEVEVIAYSGSSTPLISFYLDKDKTTAVTDEYNYDMDGSTSVFSDFPNGRIIYVDINDLGKEAGAEEIWFSYSTEKSVKLTPTKSGKTDYSKKQYLLNLSRGGMVPIHVDNAEGTGTVYVNFQCFKRTGKDADGNILYESIGSVIPVKFNMVAHDRPANVTYKPDNGGDANYVRNTAQSVVAIGTSGNTPKNDVYAKFSSTGTNYTIEGLLNEPNVIEGEEQAGVFSTEVAARKISGVQIQMYNGVPYVSTLTTMTYFYRYATTLTLSSNASQTIDLSAVPTQSVTKPTYTATYYDKVKKLDIDETDAANVAGTARYSIKNDYGANASIDAEGNVTNSTEAGRSIVTITYDSDATYTVNKRTSRMDVATATYIIYWTKSGDHMPKIEPISQKFYPSINVTVTADKEWETKYLIYDKGATAPDATTVKSSGTSIAAGATASFDITEDKTVYAVAFSGESITTVISETYTKGEQVLPPYFVPDGTTSTYYYYTETLGVEARTNTDGASVYYTLDGTDPVIGAANTYLYDGLKGITLTDGGTTTIKAIAVKDGIQSTVTTSTYQQSTLPAPYFNKNGSGEYTSGTVDVTPTDKISIGSSADPGSYSLVYYYTLDGSEPTVENGIRATSTSTFNILKTVDAKSIAVLVDGDGNIVSTSPVTTVTFKITLTDNRAYVWEANSITTPAGGMHRDDGFIVSTETALPLAAKTHAKVHLKSLPAEGQPITFAQQYVTATFGGFEFGDWNHFTISDEALGTPIDGVGEYNIRSDKDHGTNPGEDAWTEGGYMYSHIFTGGSTTYDGTYYTGKEANTPIANPTTTHEKTFLLPAKGAYVKFEPERDGDLTIWALQQGAIHYNEDDGLCDRFVRRRPVYFIDEQGKSYTAKKAESSARLSAHWNTIINGYASEGKNWFTELGAKQTALGKDVANNFYDRTESEAIYNMFLDYFTKRGDYATGYGSNIISVGDPIQPIPIHTASRASNPITERGGHNSDNSTDMTGYVMASGGYVKYTFQVQAGKTYYFFGHATKIGIRGFQFVPSEDDAAVTGRTSKTVAETGVTDAVATYGSDNTDAVKTTVKVKLDRKFNANTWAGLVLPFSVSETMMQKVFGAGTKVIHFSNVENTQINLVHHWYDMVVAGTPVLIYPTEAVDGPTFDGVQIEGITSGPETIGNDASSTYYIMGTYINLDAEHGEKENDYYITASTGNFKRLSSATSAVKPTRVWLRPKDGQAKDLTVGMFNWTDFVDDEPYEDETTALRIIVEHDTDASAVAAQKKGVYNLKGQLVSSDSTTDQLPKGVYIVNGKKVVVK